jgi:hypothetical protein
MKLSSEQTAVRAAAISAVSRFLHEVWEVEKSEPLPERIARLLAQLDDVGTSSASAEPEMGEVRASASTISA